MIKYFNQIQDALQQLPTDVILQVIQVLHLARLCNRFVFIMGNGGSASTATHFAADLSKNTFKQGMPSFRAISLADNLAAFSAYANDEGYENVYSRQIATYASPGDVVIAISGSGNSANVLNGVKEAKQIGVTTIGFTGFKGGQLGGLVDIHLNVPSSIMEQVEDIHLLLEHLICRTLREENQVLTDLLLSSRLSSFVPIDITLPSWDAEGSAGTHLLGDLARELNSSDSLHTMLQKTLELSLDGIRAASGSIIALDDQAHVMDGAVAYQGQIQTPDAKQMAVLVEQGLAGWVVRNRRVALIENTLSDPRWLGQSWERQEETPRSAISVPLLDKNHVAGVLTLADCMPGYFNKSHLILLSALSVVISFGDRIMSPDLVEKQPVSAENAFQILNGSPVPDTLPNR